MEQGGCDLQHANNSVVCRQELFQPAFQTGLTAFEPGPKVNGLISSTENLIDSRFVFGDRPFEMGDVFTAERTGALQG